MKWAVLILAGLIEVVWSVTLKYTEGYTKLLPSIINIIALCCSIHFLSKALEGLPLGIAYAVWTGIGTLGTVIVSSILFKETLSILQILCILLIVCGIVGLKVLGSK